MAILELDNLVRARQLKAEPATQAEFDGLRRSGLTRMKDAGNAALAPESRFDLAYNAAHALALAALRWHGYRSESRYLVFQVLVHTLGLPREQWRVLEQAHRKRNLAEYEGDVDIDRSMLDAVLRVTAEMESRVANLGPLGSALAKTRVTRAGGKASPAAVLLALAVATAAHAQDALTLTAVELYPTIASVSVVATFTGDDNGNAIAHVEVRPGGAGAFIPGHAMVRLSGKRFAGSVLFLSPAAVYDVRVVADDPDNGAPAILAGSVTTRGDSPPVAAGADWWVDAAGGADTNPGTRAAPFRTVQRGAVAAGPGDTVHVLPGVYREQVTPPRGGAPGAPLRFLAEGPGVVLDGSDPAIAAGTTWTNAGGSLYWTPFAEASIYAAVDDARIYDYQTLADLAAENGNIATPGVFPGGFFVDAVAGRLYLITPDHTDPGAHQIHVAVLRTAFLLDTLGDIVIEGFEVRYFGRLAANGSVGIDVRDTARAWIRGNSIHHINEGVRVRRALSSENVIEDNVIRDTSVYGWPWPSVKAHTPEGSAIAILDGRGNIVRCNDIDGTFNGIYTGSFNDPAESIASDTDVHGNRLRHIGDDGLELEGAQVNVRAWDNVIRDVYNAISIAPILAGPAFLIRNLVWGYQQHAVKANNDTAGWVFLYHTTAQPLPGTQYPGAQALAPDPFGSVTTRNNIWEGNQYVIEYIPTTLLAPVSFDSDNLFTNDTASAGRFVKWLNVRYPNLAALLASNTIEQNGFQVAPGYVNAASGDFNLVPGSALIDRGVVIPGVNDASVTGAAPDIGAFERDGAAPGCATSPAVPLPRLLRNAEWPATGKAGIFTGPQPGCPAPLDPGCLASGPPAISLDPFGPDCLAGLPSTDDDTYVSGFACGSPEPEPWVAGDLSRPLVFYQVDKAPSACNSLALVKDATGVGIRLDCN